MNTNPVITELVKSVIHKNSLSECSVNELEKLVAQYPYFGPAQFLLAQKLKQDKSPNYERQSQRAILYFQDHLWFDYLTRDEEVTAVMTEHDVSEPAIEEVQDNDTRPAKTAIVPEPVQAEEIIPEVQHDPLPVVEQQTETTDFNLQQPDMVVEETPVEEKTQVEEVGEPSQPTFTEELNQRVEEVPVFSSTDEESTKSESESVIENQGAQSLEKEPPLPSFKIEPVIAQAATLTFEPYHTVDYFASQGVRFKEEEKPKDRFGQQLKSFTEWLKTMKKAPETDAPSPANATEDRKVTQMAEHSLADREVVTEAMADVWEQQGNTAKAIDTYRKLSLLNPAKSAYFAAKIDHLKNL